jgi:iron(III) transport system substrate-binding protein
MKTGHGEILVSMKEEAVMRGIFKISGVALALLMMSTMAFAAGNLVVYSPNSDGEIQGILYYFGDKYNIKISLQSMGTGEVLSKLTAEKGNPQADVMFGGMNMGVYETNKDLFQAYVAKGNSTLPAGYQNTTGYFTNYLLSGSNLLVNTDLEKSLGLTITSYDDLLNPALKGKIASANPVSSSSAWAQLCNILLVKGGYESQQAWTYVEALIKQLSGKLTSGSSAVYKGVYQGEYVVGLTYEDPSVALLADGAKNVRVVYPKEGAVWLPAASAIVAGCKNLDNARLFMDFLISDECQKIVAGLTNRPVNTKIPNTNKFLLPMSQVKLAFEDIAYTSAHKKEIQARWTELWAKSN